MVQSDAKIIISILLPNPWYIQQISTELCRFKIRQKLFLYIKRPSLWIESRSYHRDKYRDPCIRDSQPQSYSEKKKKKKCLFFPSKCSKHYFDWFLSDFFIARRWRHKIISSDLPRLWHKDCHRLSQSFLKIVRLEVKHFDHHVFNFNWSTEKLYNNLRMKKLLIKCCWNWHRV